MDTVIERHACGADYTFIDLLAGKDHANHIATKREVHKQKENTSSLHPTLIRTLQAEGTG